MRKGGGTDKACRSLDKKIAGRCELQVTHASEAQRDRAWIGARCEYKIVFESRTVAIEDQVGARVKRCITHSRVGRDVPLECGRVTPAQVVHRPGNSFSADTALLCEPFKADAKHVCTAGFCSQSDLDAVVKKAHGKPVLVSQKLIARVSLL